MRKSSVWGNNVNDNRGHLVIDFMNSWDLAIINDPNCWPTFSSVLGESWIDLTLVSDVNLVSNWSVIDVTTLSDHEYICFQIGFNGSCRSRRRAYYMSGINWIDFNRDIQSVFVNKNANDLISDIDLGILIEKHTEEIIAICKKNMNYNSNCSTIKYTWWTSELQIMKKRIRALRTRMQRCCRLEDRNYCKEEYNKFKVIYKKKIVEAKKDYWRHICVIQNFREPFGVPYKVAAKKITSGTRYEALQVDSDGYTKTIEDTVRVLMDSHFLWESSSDNDEDIDLYDSCRIPPSTFNDDNFTMQEFENVLATIDKNKAPGLDGLTAGILIQVFNVNKDYFLSLFNMLLNKGVFPDCWKRALLVYFNKEGRDRHDPSSYRPICLLPCWSKIYDKLITDRLYHYLLTNNYLHNKQFGFIPGKNTSDAILYLKNEVLVN